VQKTEGSALMSLLEVLRRNWPLKVASFIVGFTLWLHVKTDQTYERVVSLPLEIREPSGRFVVSNDVPRTVQVRISGSGKQILVGLRHARVVLKPRVNRPEALTLDISTDDVQGLDPNRGIVVTNIEEPRSVLLDFDFLEMREAQVIPRVGIGVKPGYTVVGDVRVDPPKVRLGGPRNVIGSIRTVLTDSVVLSDVSSDVGELVTLELPREMGLVASPETVRVRATVQALAERRFSDIPVVVTNLPKRVNLIANPAVVAVDLTGGEHVLENVSADQISAEVDYQQSAQGGGADLPVKVSVPPGVRVKQITPEIVRLVPGQRSESVR